MNTEARIKEIRKMIKDFSEIDKYSANNEYVRALYIELRQLEEREQIYEEDYEEYFINGSDVPICGEYE